MDYSAFATAAGSAINSLVGSASNANLNETNRIWQAEQSALNYKRQRELIQDSPALQKQGLINAGYSPAALGNYTGPSANVSSASSPNSSASEFVPMDSRVFLDAFLAQKQGEVADSEVDKNKAEADKAKEEAGVVRPLAEAQINKLASSTRLDNSEIDKIANEVPLLQSQGDYWRFAATIEDAVAQETLATKQAQIDALMSQYKLSQAQADEAYKYVTAMAQASFELVTSQVYNNRAQGTAALSNATTNRLEYELDSMRVKLEKLGVNADVLLKSANAAYLDALKHGVPSQIRLNNANAAAARGAAGRDIEQGKKTKAERKLMPLDYMLKGVDTYSRLINSSVGATKSVLPFMSW
jgi:hypothetical protein